MPDIFDTDNNTARDRRMIDDTSEPASAPPPEPAMSNIIHFPAPEPRPKHMIGNNRMHIFSAFCEIPDGVTFEAQEDDEKILLLLRKSFITNIPWLFIATILSLIPPVSLQFIHPENTPLVFLSPAYIFVLLSLYYLFIAAYVFISFITWYFNTSLITTKRIVDIDFEDLVYKNIAETKIDLVQDVSYTQSGVIRTLFGYGDVLVQTAGPIDNFDLRAVPHPYRAVEVMENLIGKDGKPGV